MKYDVFISYSSKNIETALAICHVLENNNIRCWMAPRNIPAGSDYGDVIDVAITECKVFLLLYSKPAATSNWVSGELNVAFEEGKHIIPYSLDKTPLKGSMRVMLSQRHWIDAHPDANNEFKLLVENILPVIGIKNVSRDSRGTSNNTDIELAKDATSRIKNTNNKSNNLDSNESCAKIHFKSDMDCCVMKFGQEVGLFEAGKFNTLLLTTGRHFLDFISLEHPADHVEIVYEVKNNNIEDFFAVELCKIRDQRLKDSAIKAEKEQCRIREQETARQEERKKREEEQRRAKAQEIARQEARRRKEEENEAQKRAAILREREIQRAKDKVEIAKLREQRLARERAEKEAIEQKWARKSQTQTENKQTTLKQSGAKREVKTLTFSSGNIYVGEVNSRGKLHGKGVYTWTNGDKYQGDFVEGYFHGMGVFIWANGDKYEGGFVEGVQHGKGVYTWSNGLRETQEYKNGNRQTTIHNTEHNSTTNNSTRNLILFQEDDNSYSYSRKYGYKDQYGNVVVSPKYYRGDSFSEGRAKVESGKFGFIDTNGKEVIPLIYENAMRFSEGLAAVMRNGLWGYIDYYGKVIIPFKYKDAYSFSNGSARVRQDGQTYSINKYGNRI